MEGHTRTSILLLLITLNSITSALEARKVLNIPEKIIGGVIDIVQSHKNKPTQETTTVQSQTQQQVYQQGYHQQYAPWNTGYLTQNQGQVQGQYGNYGNPQSGNSYPQGSYVNTQTYPSGQQYGGTQAQNQGQYQTYPQNQSGNQFQVQNQQTTGSFVGQQTSQFQNQVQTGAQGQGQQGQVQIQNQNFQNQNFQNQNFQNQNHQTGEFVNHNQFNNGNFQGSSQVTHPTYQNQPSGGFVQPQPTGTYGGHQQSSSTATNQQSGTFVGQTQPNNNYVGQNHPQGQVTQPTYLGQNHQSSQFQGVSGNQSIGPGVTGSNSGGFQISTGLHSGGPGPTCVCQAWTKPPNGVLNDNASQRSEEKVEKPNEK